MKRLHRILLLVLAVALLVPALPAVAAHGHGGGGGHSHGGHGHSGGGHVYVGVGGGWGWGWWGWPGYYGYGPGYYGYYGSYYRPYGYGPSAQWARIDTDVSPEEAGVYLDGRYIGTADDFDGYPDYLYLKPGRYRIEFRLEGFEPLTREIEARPGMTMDFTDKLRKIPGAKQYGSYEHPKQQGEVQRYYGKRRDSVEPIDPSQPPGNSVVYEGSDEDRQGPPPEVRAPAPSDEQWRGSQSQSPRVEARTRLRLKVEPPDAAVYVDNRFVGTAEEVTSLERGLSVAPGKHIVTGSRPGFRDKTSEISIEQGRTETLEISLGR